MSDSPFRSSGDQTDYGRNYSPTGLPHQPYPRFGYTTYRSGCRRRPVMALLIAFVVALMAIVVVVSNLPSGEYVEYPMVWIVERS